MEPRDALRVILRRPPAVTPELLLRTYRAGIFPMAEARDDERLYWLDPEERGIIPLDRFHLPRRLARTVRAGDYEVSADRDFPAVIAACAAAGPGREGTWINATITRAFRELAALGHAHSVECRAGGALVGGLYGVAIGGAFFGESMFSTERDASKVALVHLVARLRLGGFALLDAQFVTSHLAQFGAEEISRAEYRARLAASVDLPAHFEPAPAPGRLAAEIEALRGRNVP